MLSDSINLYPPCLYLCQLSSLCLCLCCTLPDVGNAHISARASETEWSILGETEWSILGETEWSTLGEIEWSTLVWSRTPVPVPAALLMQAVQDAVTEPGAGVRGRVGGRLVAAGKRDWVQAQVGRLESSKAGMQMSHGGGLSSSISSSGGGSISSVSSHIGTEDSNASSSVSSSSVSSRSSGSGSGAVGEAGLVREAGASAVWVGVEGEGVVGVLGLRDRLRPDARDTVNRLRQRGIR